ncbi:MAG: hypothetical protein AAF195_04030 [Pseudomonadota bacterium]
MNKTKIAVIVTSVILGVIYFSLMPAASNGYGYAGYRGYNSGPSFFYFGSTRTYHNRDYNNRNNYHSRNDRNIRNRSSGSSSMRGGGPSRGK